MTRTIILLVVGAVLLGGCSTSSSSSAMSGAYAPRTAICVLQGTAGNENVAGQIVFRRVGDSVVVEAEVSGLTPGRHGFHVHEFGDVNCSDGTCTGGHFNPAGLMHGGPDSAQRHVGDLGNLVAGSDGVARYRREDHLISLDMNSANCVIGRAIIVHADADDLTSQPTGAAGARLAAGVIGVGKE